MPLTFSIIVFYNIIKPKLWVFNYKLLIGILSRFFKKCFLKPTTDTNAQIIVKGKPVGNMSVEEI